MKVIFTVDTEPSIGGYFKNPKHLPLIDEPIAGNIHGKSEALGYLIRLFSEYNFTATFFIETVNNCYFSDHRMGRYVQELKAARQDIQLHIHPVWKSFQRNRFVSDNCHEHKLEFLVELMRHGKELIKKWTGDYPTAMRTGRFSVSPVVYEAMRWSSLNISSNICLACFMPEQEDLHFTNGIHKISDIYELPATCFIDRSIVNFSGYRPLQITSIGHYEMIDILNKMEHNGHEIAVIVTHPFEFIKTTDYRYRHMRLNKLVRKRAERLCEYLSEHSDRFDVVPLSDPSLLSAKNTHYIAKGHPLMAFRRSAENFINDNIF